MYRDHTIGVVVPAYNEEGFVGDVIETMPAYADRLYVVDDCSTDGTWAEIREHAERENSEPAAVNYDEDDVLADVESDRVTADGGVVATEGAADSASNSVAAVFDRRVVPIQHEVNRGVGGAIKTGYQRALEDEIDITAVMGGDGQMDPDILYKFLDPIVEDEADYTKGNRLLYREYRQGMSKWRFVGNSVLTFLTKISSGYWKTMDPQNGYTAISYYALDNVGIGNMYEYYGYCNDLLVKLNAKGMRVADVAMPAVYGDEESSIKYSVYMRKVSGMLLKNFLWRLKVKYLVLDFHPLALFYYFGAGTALLGLLGGMWSVYEKVVLGNPLFMRASSSLMLFTMGSMFIMFAMLFDMQVNESKEVQIRD
ncbi:family 2 glycosyl transferase [Halovivax asiaticus JCM 14624]|uniref:Family 2 glycosyl transferase n=1 Tax=Halovivax asiaticus JCM 14624 TaxID=1227490 RepID=M0BNG4_9EURY|nr:glycosyltransferase [Halovivax asiaticus]ELZ11159.1 family 2 glycosyl transferase [Halovivax asiaticus JCM 14624]